MCYIKKITKHIEMERIVRIDDKQTHERNIREMSKFLDDGKPKIGIFWFNPNTFTLFGVSKKDAGECLDKLKNACMFHHKTFWEKWHHRAIDRNEKDSIFFNKQNYTLIPKAEVYYNNGKYVVQEGDWISGLDVEKFSELIQDEFNIPDEFEFEIDDRWNLGLSCPEERF